MNDGACDAAGRYLAGRTADGTPRRAGALLSWDGGEPRVVWDGLELPNGVGWSPDGRTLYLADSLTRVLYAADYDIGTGSVTGRRALVSFAPGDGLPDGLCVDDEGGIWVAMWDGAAVRRHAPDGRLLRTVPIPVSRPTSCALAPDGTLYVTSARPGTGDPDAEPSAGSVFAVATGLRPVPVHAFAH